MRDGTPPADKRIGFADGRFTDDAGSRLLIGILSCDKHRGRADGIRNTWQKLLPARHQLLFIHGRPGQPPAIEGDRLYLDCPEAYELLPRKVHAFLDYASRHLAFDCLFKTDDDTYLDLERFLAFDRDGGDYIGQFREQPVGLVGKTWHYGKCDDKRFETPWERPFICPWATGGGYFLSRRAVALAVEKTAATMGDSLFEDMMVGEALTLEPGLKVVRSRFAEMGVINPLLPKDMAYVQDLLLEKRRLAEELQLLRAQRASPTPMVSVVVPVHDAAPFLAASLGSVLAQTLRDIEVVCVDDGSTDDSLEVLRRVAGGDPRVRVLALGTNQGASAARNAGIDIARGQFVFFLDADDTLPDDALERLVEAARRGGCELAMGKLDWLREAGDARQARDPSASFEPTIARADASNYLQSVPGCHCCNLYGRGLLERHGIRYETDLSFGEDQLFQATAIAKAGRVAMIEPVVYVYHHYRGQSLTRRPPGLKNLLDDVEFQRRIARMFAANGLREAGLRFLGSWSYSIRQYWLQIPATLELAQASRFFSCFREMAVEFDIVPWNQSTPAHHRHLLELVLAGRDAEAYAFLATDEARTGIRQAVAP